MNLGLSFLFLEKYCFHFTLCFSKGTMFLITSQSCLISFLCFCDLENQILFFICKNPWHSFLKYALIAHICKPIKMFTDLKHKNSSSQIIQLNKNQPLEEGFVPDFYATHMHVSNTLFFSELIRLTYSPDSTLLPLAFHSYFSPSLD